MKPLSRYSCFVAITACLSGFLFGYYMAIVSGALTFISSAFQFSIGKESLFVSVILLGAVLGSSMGGYLTNRFGRKNVFFLTSFFLILGCILLVNANSFSILLVSRIIQGVSIGTISVVTPLYLGEISPNAHRGRIVSTYQLMMNFGILCAYIVNDLFISTGNWQMMFLVGLIPLILQIVFLFFIPESPLWLFGKKQKTLALEVLKKLQLPTSFEPVKEKKTKIDTKTVSFLLWIGILLSAFQQITGINIVIYYAPRIFYEAGYTSSLSAMIATTILGVANLVACFMSVWLLDRVGRRKLLLIGVFGMMISLLCFSIFSYSKSSFIDELSMVLLIAYIFFFSMGIGPVTWVLLSEIYPPEIRDKAMSFSLLTNWIAVFFVLWTFPYLLAWIKIPGTFGLYSLMNLVAFLFILKNIPETKQKSLVEVFKIFKRK